ncbi:hypothetical protein [Streptomyces malaysiensis]|uniref:hypothetical protein n=1 Tax=Streptomyces malaysiensis TaxID=92644 RepID=UPI0037146BC1
MGPRPLYLIFCRLLGCFLLPNRDPWSLRPGCPVESSPPPRTILERTVNGRPGLAVESEGRIETVFAFAVSDDNRSRSDGRNSR